MGRLRLADFVDANFGRQDSNSVDIKLLSLAFGLFSIISLWLSFSLCSIEELVKVNRNGLLISTSSELVDELMVRTTFRI